MAQNANIKIEYFCFPIFTAHYPFDSQAFHVHGGTSYIFYENVNMTQIEIQRSEKSERK